MIIPILGKSNLFETDPLAVPYADGPRTRIMPAEETEEFRDRSYKF